MRSLGTDLWVIDHPEFAIGLMQLGTRTTVVRKRDGSLVLHSVGPLSAAQFENIRALGPVSGIIVANRGHNMFVEAAHAAFPEAKVYASESIRAKVPGLKIGEVLADNTPGDLRDDLAMLPFLGAKAMDERVFFHAPSRTLIAVDVAFNIHNATGATRFLMWINDANDKLCMTRLGKSLFLDDFKAAATSVDAMCSTFDFDRLIVAHGNVYEGGAREALHAAYAFGR